jgi:hypothetical protein
MTDLQLELADEGLTDYTLYDAIDVNVIPKDARAVAGYVDGAWPTYSAVRHRFPAARAVAITVFGHASADVIDCEHGDATPDGAVAYVQRMRRIGSWAPGIYASLDAWPDLLQRLSRAGIPREHFRVWTAHWTGKPHRCSSACLRGFATVAGATQWTNSYGGQNLDVSLAWRPFFVR